MGRWLVLREQDTQILPESLLWVLSWRDKKVPHKNLKEKRLLQVMQQPF